MMILFERIPLRTEKRPIARSTSVALCGSTLGANEPQYKRDIIGRKCRDSEGIVLVDSTNRAMMLEGMNEDDVCVARRGVVSFFVVASILDFLVLVKRVDSRQSSNTVVSRLRYQTHSRIISS